MTLQKMWLHVLLLSCFFIGAITAELKISDVHECLWASDIYFYGNSVSRGTFKALEKILKVREGDEDWHANITAFGHKALHNRMAEKEECENWKGQQLTMNGTTLPHSCDAVLYDNTTKRINLMYVYWQRIFTKDLYHRYFNSLRERSHQQGTARKNIIMYNAGLDDIINHFSNSRSVHNCPHAHGERKKYDGQINDLFQWAEAMTNVSDFTFRSTTPANASPDPRAVKYGNCWNKECPHMNLLINIMNEKMLEVYKNKKSTRVNYLDGWKVLGGYCTDDPCSDNDKSRCYTSRFAEYDDWYHSAYLAYDQLAPWLEHICKASHTPTSAGVYLT